MQGVDLDERRPRWIRRIVGLLVVLVIGGAAAFFIHRTVAGGSQQAQPYQPYTVGTMTLRALVQTAGVSVAQDEADLSFITPGQVSKLYVNIGDHVTVGQPLVGLKADQLQNAASTARSALTLAQLQLQKLQEGATATDLGKADEAVVAANAAFTKAQNDLKDATDPPTDTELTAAHQAVAAAQAAQSAAEAKLEALRRGATDADIAAAQAAVDGAESKLSQAQRALDVATAQRADAQSGFEYAATAYCNLSGSLVDVCHSLHDSNYQTVLTSTQVQDLLHSVQSGQTPTPSPGLQAAVPALVTANDTYRSAIAAVGNANDAVTAATSARDAAQKALDSADEGANSDDIDAAKQAVAAAQASVDASQAALQKLIDGPSDTIIADLQAAVDKAQTDVLVAQIASDEVGRGATATELAMQQEQVHQAELALQRANLALNDMTLTSPFDGIVSALPVKIGQVVNASVPAVTVLTPGQMVFDLNVGETDLPSIRLGEQGTMTFDAIPTKVFPIEVTAVSLSPETNQGVIIYKVKCRIDGNLNDPNGPNPAPGMNGSASLVTDTRPDVVAIPSALVRSRGVQKVVEVEVTKGKTEMRPVVTGLSDGDNIEITKGLSVGDVLAVHTVATPTPASGTDQQIPGHFQ
jgi:HlyD family secretion protein